MAERNVVKPRTCEKCKEVKEATAQEIKQHVKDCAGAKGGLK